MSDEYKNYPISECAQAADKIIQAGGTVFQKWTCVKCQSRQTMPLPNVFYTKGQCEECKHVTNITITGCNYAVIWVGSIPKGF